MTPSQRDAFCGGKTSLYQRLAGILAPLILLGTIVYLAAIYHTLPDRIPTNFSPSGEITGWSGRGTLWIMPIIGLVTDFVIWIVGLFPQSWNTGTRVTVFNRARVYSLLRDLMADLRLGMAVMWAVISFFLIHSADGFPGWIIALTAAAGLIIPLARYFLRLYRKQ